MLGNERLFSNDINSDIVVRYFINYIAKDDLIVRDALRNYYSYKVLKKIL